MQYWKYDAKNIVLHKIQHFFVVVVEQYLKGTKGSTPRSINSRYLKNDTEF